MTPPRVRQTGNCAQIFSSTTFVMIVVEVVDVEVDEEDETEELRDRKGQRNT